jgi:hypothetical protein
MEGQKLLKRTFAAADAMRPLGSGQAALIGLGAVTLTQVTLPPAWRWSHDVKPVANTSSCQDAHVGYLLAGRLHVVMDDGTEEIYAPGNLAVIPPGHDAWVEGDAPVVALEFTGAEAARFPRPEVLPEFGHEVRVPLSLVIGYAEVLQSQEFGELNGQQEAYLQDIVDAAHHLRVMLDRSLGLSKFQATVRPSQPGSGTDD